MKLMWPPLLQGARLGNARPVDRRDSLCPRPVTESFLEVTSLRRCRAGQPRRRYSTFRYLLLLLFIFLACDVAMACPACKESMAQSNPHLAEGFSRSIALMMSVPYLLFGALTFKIARSAHRKKK